MDGSKGWEVVSEENDLNDEIETPESSDLDIFPISEDIAFFVGDIEVLRKGSQLDIVTFDPDFLTEIPRQQLFAAIQDEYSKINVSLQFADGINKAQGFVKLAPETVALMKAGNIAKIGEDGYRIGALADNSGKFVGTVKWLPVSKASVALSGIANASNALTMALIQMKLASIEKISLEVLENVQQIHGEILREQWGKIGSSLDYLQESACEVADVGKLTEDKYREITSNGLIIDLPTLDKMQIQRLQDFNSEFQSLSSLEARHKWLMSNFRDILGTAEALIKVHRASNLYDQFKILYQIQKDPSPALGTEIERMVSNRAASLRNREMRFMHDYLPVIESLVRQCQLIAKAPGTKKQLMGLKKNKGMKVDVIQNSDHLGQMLASMFPSLVRPRSVFSDSTLTWIRDREKFEEQVGMYSLLCAHNEWMVGVSNIGKGSNLDRMLIVTNKRIFQLKVKDFMHSAKIDFEFELNRLGYSQNLIKQGDLQKFLVCFKNTNNVPTYFYDDSTKQRDFGLPEFLNAIANPSRIDFDVEHLMIGSTNDDF